MKKLYFDVHHTIHWHPSSFITWRACISPRTVMCNAQISLKIFGLHYWLLGNKYILINKEK